MTRDQLRALGLFVVLLVLFLLAIPLLCTGSAILLGIGA